MTLQLTLSCDGTWDDGRMPCRGALPTNTALLPTALIVANEAGWHIGRHGDLCPAHVKHLEDPV